MARAAYIAAVAVALFSGAALAQGQGNAAENYESWRLHTPKFPSTGGNGVIIGEYYPVISGDKCTTDFTATLADGKVYYNTVEFDAVPAQGGILCTNGRWRARDGSSNGTTPYRVFFKDGVLRGSP
jgi:hypothetical protein